jgi:hypothetical protein
MVLVTIEIHVPIIIACIPTLKPLVPRVCPRLLESGQGSAASSDGPNRPTISSAAGRPWGSKIGQT